MFEYRAVQSASRISPADRYVLEVWDRSVLTWKRLCFRGTLKHVNESSLCAGTPHDTNHLFNCPAKPTTLTPIDLWENPMQATAFLDLIPTLESVGDVD
jgi:hypothetical protein